MNQDPYRTPDTVDEPVAAMRPRTSLARIAVAFALMAALRVGVSCLFDPSPRVARNVIVFAIVLTFAATIASAKWAWAHLYPRWVARQAARLEAELSQKNR